MTPWRRHALSALLAATLLAGCAPQAQEADHGHDGHGHHDDHGHGDHAHAAGEVRLPTAQQQQIKLKTAEVAPRPLSATLTTTGEFEANADREAHVTSRVAGRVVSIAKTVGDRVAAGEAMATLESVELGEAQSAFLEALARHELALATVGREERLFAEDLTAGKQVQAARNEAQLTRIALDNVKSRLRLLGMAAGRIDQLAARKAIDPVIPLAAPIGGTVIAKHITVGEMLEPNAAEPAYTLLDTRELWVEANLYERDLARVREGMPAIVTTPAYPDQRYRGRVSLISARLDKETRTARARIVVENPEGRLKPEMFASVQLTLGEASVLAVPDSALMQEKGETFVFVQQGEETFQRVPVKVGAKVEGYYPVDSGLQGGERVVVEGGLTLKAEMLKDSFGEHSH